MTIFQAWVLGTVQGVTEFLPISSSAHLILARVFLGWQVEGYFSLAFDIACHVGTLLALLAYFRDEVISLIVAGYRFVVLRPSREPDHRLLHFIVVGTLPVAIVGILLGDLIVGKLRTPLVAAISLAVGAIVMLVAERIGKFARSDEDLTWKNALWLGVAQATALIPGVSRSGAVLTVAMLMGFQRKQAARLAFLLGIPAIFGAGLMGVVDLVEQGLPSAMLLVFGVGVCSSAFVGYLVIWGFLRFVSRFSLNSFALYRLGLAALVLLGSLE